MSVFAAKTPHSAREGAKLGNIGALGDIILDTPRGFSKIV